MKATDNVYPLHAENHAGYLHFGLEARDYIAIQAIQAMAAIVASPNFHNYDTAAVARDAYNIADAVIKQSEVRDEQSV